MAATGIEASRNRRRHRRCRPRRRRHRVADLRTELAAATARLGERADAEALLLHVLGQPRSWLFAHADDTLGMDVRTAFEALVARRAAGEPVAYLTGRRGFWTLELEVTPA